MSRAARKVLLVIGVVILLVIVYLISGSSESGRLKLPTGKVKPAISLGERHGLILASDGSLWSWGSDFLGWPVLGLETGVTHTVCLRRIGRETHWVAISAGASHSLALKSDGTLWTWGESVQVRYVMPASISAPTLAAPGNDWKQAAAGLIHNLAIKRDGTLWGWGNNWAGSVGIAATNGSIIPVQIGSETNWVRVWASTLESVGMQADGSLWYWGDSLNPAFPQSAGTRIPTRVNTDTNWVDVGFGVNTVFAIKSDGTLWVWGRQADRYTSASDPVQNTIPSRLGTDSDWRSISACAGWWCQGLIKKDGSLWFMDASEGKPNGPRTPYQPVRFKRVEFQKDYVAYAAGATHAAAAGVHGPIGVMLTPEGEVWTWGMVLGDPPTLKGRFQGIITSLARSVGFKAPRPDLPPVFRNQLWQLRNVE